MSYMVGRYFLLGLVLLSGIAFAAFHGLSLLSKGAATVETNKTAAHDWDTFSAQVGDWRVTGQMVERSAKRLMMEI